MGWSLVCEGSRASRTDQVGQGLGAAATGLPAAALRFPQMETFYFDVVGVVLRRIFLADVRVSHFR